MSTRGRIALATAVLLVLATGCSSTQAGPTGTTAAPPASTRTVTAGTLTSEIATTVTSTAAGNTITAAPPPATSEPAPVDGPCPYLSDDAVAQINGQRTGTTQVIAVEPYPICVFSRSDGGALASVRVIEADTPQAAVAAVDAHVPIEASNPANQPPGWTGGSMVTDNGSVYAVSKGTIAIVAESNQQQSIKGRQMVVMTVEKLGL
ncbi:DUF2020 domain-containing protein [Nakamurella sp. GG22]